MNLKLKINIISFLEYLLIIFVILECRSIYSVTTDNNFYLPYFIVIFTFIIIVCSLNHISLTKTQVKFLIVWAIYILVFMLFSNKNKVELISRFLVTFSLMYILFCYYLKKNRIRNFCQKYSNIILIIAVISLSFWLIGSLLHIVNPSGMIDIYWGKDITVSNYYYIYFQWQNDAFINGHRIYRNIGIFTEAPMYSLHLTIAFMYELIFAPKKSKFRIILLALTILSTVSTTGIVLMISMFGYKIVQPSLYKLFIEKKITPWMLILPLICITIMIVILILFMHKIASASGSSRVEDYYVGYLAWKQKPLFGAGYGDISARTVYMTKHRMSRAESGFTNSPMTVLVEGGLYFATCYLLAFSNLFIKAVKSNMLDLAAFVMGILFLFLTTIFPHTCLMIAFIAFSFAYSIRSSNSANV